jgi:hypothetical protein
MRECRLSVLCKGLRGFFALIGLLGGGFCSPQAVASCTTSVSADLLHFDSFDPNTKARWIRQAFATLESGNYPRLKAISWWHENSDSSCLRIDSSPESLIAYRQGVASLTFVSNPVLSSSSHLLPPASAIYHAAIPDFGGSEDLVSAQRIQDFEALAAKPIAWAYFSNNWLNGIAFPQAQVDAIIASGHLPFIRMMPRSSFNPGGPDPVYQLQRFLDGDFDAELDQWCADAAAHNGPLLVEFGTEVNGDWFPWNGQYNGAGTTTGYGDPALADGPERFRDTCRHIIERCDAAGASNITWFFHVDAYSQPDTAWNSMAEYYPGDAWIDWLGLSVYGPQQAGETLQDFNEILADAYPLLSALGNQPIAVLEWGITEL